MKCLRVLCFTLFLISQTSAQVARRGVSHANSRFFTQSRATKTNTVGRFSPSHGTQFKSSTKTLECPMLKKSSSRSLTTEAFFSKAQETQGRRILNFIKRNPGKTIGLVSGIGAATELRRRDIQKERVQPYLRKFSELLRLYAYGEQIIKLEIIFAYIEKLAQAGLINEKNYQNNSPLMMVLKAPELDINDATKALLLKHLFKNGATLQPNGHKELNLALTIPEDSKDLREKGLRLYPNIESLKVILPRCNRETIESLKDVYEDKINEFQKGLLYAKSNLENLQKERGIFGFFFNRKKQNDEEKLSGIVNSYQDRLHSFLRLRDIINEALAKHETFQNITANHTHIESLLTKSSANTEPPVSLLNSKEEELTTN